MAIGLWGSPSLAAMQDWVLQPLAPADSVGIPEGDAVNGGLAPPVTLPPAIALQGAADRFVVWQERLIVGQIESQRVSAWSLQGDVLWEVDMGFTPTVLLLDDKRQRLYVSGINSPVLVILDPVSGRQTGVVDLPGGAIDLTRDPVSGQVFAAIPSAQNVVVFSPLTMALRTYAMPGSPLAVAFDAQAGRLITALAEPDPLGVLVLNPDNGELLARWRSGRMPEALAIAGENLLVLNSGSQELLQIRLASNGQEVQRIGLDWRPTRLSVVGSYAYITSRDANRIQVVHLPTGRLVETWTTGSQPTGIVAVDAQRLAVVAAGIPQIEFLPTVEAQPNVDVAAVATVNTGAISGRVVDVALQPVGTGQVRWQQQTVPIQPDGSFLLSEMPVGIHLVDVQVPDYPATTQQVQVRQGFVSTPTVRLPPKVKTADSNGIGIVPDGLPFSDELARQLGRLVQERYPTRPVRVLRSPVGVDPEFAPLQDLLTNLSVVDNNERYSTDIGKLQVIGNTLGLRYLLITQMQISQDYNRQGNNLVNLAFRFIAPGIPIQIPNFTPNMLRSRGGRGAGGSAQTPPRR